MHIAVIGAIFSNNASCVRLLLDRAGNGIAKIEPPFPMKGFSCLTMASAGSVGKGLGGDALKLIAAAAPELLQKKVGGMFALELCTFDFDTQVSTARRWPAFEGRTVS